MVRLEATTKRQSILAILVLLYLMPCVCHAGPFGLEAGMSRAEVVQRIGKSAIVKEYDDYNHNYAIFFNTVPMPSAYFDEYQCGFDKNKKLLSINASSKPLLTQSKGADLRASFDRLKSALEGKYGKVLYVTGNRASGTDWLDSVGYQHPFTEAVWDGSSDYSKSSHIDKITLEIEVADRDHGFIELSYYFNTGIEGPL